jgi:hypothetical protein
VQRVEQSRVKGQAGDQGADQDPGRAGRPIDLKQGEAGVGAGGSAMGLGVAGHLRLQGLLPARDHALHHRLDQEYERWLPLAIYLPYTLLMAGNLLLFVRPETVALSWLVLLLLLNGSIMAASLALAAPVHARLDHEGKRAELLLLLRRYNLPRLVASAASRLSTSVLLAQVLAI